MVTMTMADMKDGEMSMITGIVIVGAMAIKETATIMNIK